MPTWILGGQPKPLSAYADEQEMSAIDQAKASMLLDDAEGTYLNKIGGNYGVTRDNLDSNDEIYRNLVAVLAWQPKTILQTLYSVAGAIFGTQGDIVSQGMRPWRVFEVNANEIIFELPLGFTASTNETSTYFHGFSGIIRSLSGGNTVLTTDGDATQAAVDLTTLNAYVKDTGDFPYVAHAVLSATYDAPSDTTTITLSSATSSTALGTAFFIDVPGDTISSFRGDYLAPSAVQSSDTPTTPKHNDRVYLTGEGLLDLFLYYLNTFCRASGIVLRVVRVGSSS